MKNITTPRRGDQKVSLDLLELREVRLRRHPRRRRDWHISNLQCTIPPPGAVRNSIYLPVESFIHAVHPPPLPSIGCLPSGLENLLGWRLGGRSASLGLHHGVGRQGRMVEVSSLLQSDCQPSIKLSEILPLAVLHSMCSQLLFHCCCCCCCC